MALTPSPITLASAQAQLTNWLTALENASTGGSYSIGGRTLTRQDVPTIRAEIQRWSNTVATITERLHGRVRPMGATASFPAPGRGTSGSGTVIPNALWIDGRT